MTLGTTDGATSLTDTAKLPPGRLDTFIRNVGGEELWAGTATTRLYTFGVADFPVVNPPGSNNFPQGLGHFSATFATGVTHLEFVDWPARIGIDRLDPVFVPEPETASLVAFALAGLGLARAGRFVSR